jgi:hypothetical protein
MPGSCFYSASRFCFAEPLYTLPCLVSTTQLLVTSCVIQLYAGLSDKLSDAAASPFRLWPRLP